RAVICRQVRPDLPKDGRSRSKVSAGRPGKVASLGIMINDPLANLAQIVPAPHRPISFASKAKRRKNNENQGYDNPRHDHEVDECEPAAYLPDFGHGLTGVGRARGARHPGCVVSSRPVATS